MCRIMDEITKEVVLDEKVQTAMKMIARGKLSLEEIAEYSGLPLEKIKELAAENSKVNA